MTDTKRVPREDGRFQPTHGPVDVEGPEHLCPPIAPDHEWVGGSLRASQSDAKDAATDDQVFAITQELIRVACEKICDAVLAIEKGRGADPDCESQSFWAGYAFACEEIKTRISDLTIPFAPQISAQSTGKETT